MSSFVVCVLSPVKYPLSVKADGSVDGFSPATGNPVPTGPSSCAQVLKCGGSQVYTQQVHLTKAHISCHACGIHRWQQSLQPEKASNAVSSRGHRCAIVASSLSVHTETPASCCVYRALLFAAVLCWSRNDGYLCLVCDLSCFADSSLRVM